MVLAHAFRRTVIESRTVQDVLRAALRRRLRDWG